ncbi:hypothetical protein Hanom_Chr16g01433751 [Helianthus anomalus]
MVTEKTWLVVDHDGQYSIRWFATVNAVVDLTEMTVTVWGGVKFTYVSRNVHIQDTLLSTTLLFVDIMICCCDICR